MTEQEKIDSIFASVFRLPPKMCHLLRLLMQFPAVNIHIIQSKLDIDYDARVIIYRLRKRLFDRGIIIHSQYGGHYWLTKETKAQIREIIHGIMG